VTPPTPSCSVDRAVAEPDAALSELAGVWDSLADRAAFILRDIRAADGRRHIRPAILPATKDPSTPPGSDRREPGHDRPS